MKKNLKRSFSSRSFGYLVSAILSIYGSYKFFYNENIEYWLFISSIIILLFAIFYPKIFNRPADLWHKIGLFIHAIFSPIILTFVYILSILIVGLIMKIFKRDPLRKKFDNKLTTYWENKKTESNKIINLKDQY